MGISRKPKVAMYIAYVVLFVGGPITGLANQKGLNVVSGIAMAITFVAGVFIVASMSKTLLKRDAEFLQVVATNGKRHEVIIKNSNARRIVQDWAAAAGYSLHVASTDSKVVYSKGGMLLIPIFVSYDFEHSKLESWIQANGQASSIFDGPIISIPHKIARNDFENLQSKFGVVSLKCRRSD